MAEWRLRLAVAQLPKKHGGSSPSQRTNGRMVELIDALVLRTSGMKIPCRFESYFSYHFFKFGLLVITGAHLLCKQKVRVQLP